MGPSAVSRQLAYPFNGNQWLFFLLFLFIPLIYETLILSLYINRSGSERQSAAVGPNTVEHSGWVVERGEGNGHSQQHKTGRPQASRNGQRA